MPAIKWCDMENEMMYDIALHLLNEAINEGLIDNFTYELLLSKLNEKLHPIVPKITSFIR